MADGHIDRRVEHDARAGRHRRDRGLREVEERVDVRVERVVPLLRRKRRDVRVRLLRAVVEDAGDVILSVPF
jgi:hypothetical protein